MKPNRTVAASFIHGSLDPAGILGPERTVPDEIAELYKVAGADGTHSVLYRWRDRHKDRPTVLFQHANGFNAGCYLPLLDRLAERCNILAVDLRGHGAADKPDPAIPFEQCDAYAPLRFAEDIRALCDFIDEEFNLGPLHLASHSLGGIGAIIYAADQGPAAFASMTMFEPPLIPADQPAHAISTKRALGFADWAARRRGEFASAEEFEAEFDRVQTYRTFSADMRAAHLTALIARQADGFSLRCPGPVESMIYRRNPAFATGRRVREVAVPGVIYCADPALGNNPGWVAYFQKICAASPGLEARIMSGCNHLMVQEAPECCAEAVLQNVFR